MEMHRSDWLFGRTCGADPSELDGLCVRGDTLCPWGVRRACPGAGRFRRADRASDATLERLRAKILSGELPPGSVVSQTTLARDLGISTTPLREVIRQLQAEGLLEMELNRRPRVAPLDVGDLHAIYAGRILLESLAAELTVPLMTADDLDGIQADLAEMREVAAAGRLDLWGVPHDRMHRRLFAEVPAAMRASLTGFYDRSDRYRRFATVPGQPRNWLEADAEHERIVEACLARAGRAASAELANHLARTALSLSAAFAPEVDPRAVRLAVGMVTCSGPLAPPARKRARRSA